MSLPLPPILAAEDEDDERFILKLAHEKAKLAHPLVTVSDGKECVDYLEGAGEFADRVKYPLPALLILDLKMPSMNAFEVLEWLSARQDFKDLPVFVLSSSSSEADIRKARELGARDYFVKPHMISDLTAVLQALERRWLAATLSAKS